MAIPFHHLNAFTSRPLSGNPAAVFLLSPSNTSHIDLFEDDKKLQQIAGEFNLPASAFLLPSTPTHGQEETVPIYKIKWFDPHLRIPICGHGTLAASSTLFSLPTHANHTTIKYDAGPAGSLSASKEGEFILLEFPGCQLVGLDQAGEAIKQGVQFEQVVQKSLGLKEGDIKFVGRGDRGGYVDLIVVELKEDYPLKDVNIDNYALEVLLPEIRGIILTTRTNTQEHHIESRVIHSSAALGEDSATGSAHCILAPYWISKLGLKEGEDLKARQVSKRGGEMKLRVKKNDALRVEIRAKCVQLAQGELDIEL